MSGRGPGVDVEEDVAVIRAAVRMLVPRWRLPEHVATIALGDIAEDLGVEVRVLSRLVVESQDSDGTSTG